MHDIENWKWSCLVMPTLRGPRDCSLPGSSVRGIFQARVLEWVATSYYLLIKQPFGIWSLTLSLQKFPSLRSPRITFQITSIYSPVPSTVLDARGTFTYKPHKTPDLLIGPVQWEGRDWLSKLQKVHQEGKTAKGGEYGRQGRGGTTHPSPGSPGPSRGREGCKSLPKGSTGLGSSL